MLLAAPKLIDLDRHKPNMAKAYFVKCACDAAFILEQEQIDRL
jgi:hypothetical protein